MRSIVLMQVGFRDWGKFCGFFFIGFVLELAFSGGIVMLGRIRHNGQHFSCGTLVIG